MFGSRKTLQPQHNCRYFEFLSLVTSGMMNCSYFSLSASIHSNPARGALPRGLCSVSRAGAKYDGVPGGRRSRESPATVQHVEPLLLTAYL